MALTSEFLGYLGGHNREFDSLTNGRKAGPWAEGI